MNKKLKIGIFTTSYLPSVGGAEIGLHNLSNALFKKGHTVTVITSYTHYRKLKSFKDKLPYQIISLPPRIIFLLSNFPLLGMKVLNLFFDFVQSKQSFDFWHISFAYPLGVYSIRYCKKKNIPHALMCHGEDIQVNKYLNYGIRINKKIDNLVKEWLPKAQSLIANSESMVKEYKKLNVNVNKISLIPFGIDLARVRNHKIKFNFRRRFGIESDSIIFLCLGRYHRKKNFESVISAFKALNVEENYKIDLIIAGSGVGLLNKLRDIEKNIHIFETSEPTKNFQFKFPSDEVFDLYSQSDVFIMPSLLETLGVVTLEAASFGLPIIIAKSPGNIDIFKKKEECLFYNGHTKDLIKKLKIFLKDSKISEKMKEGSKLVSKRFDYKTISINYEKLFHNLIES